MRIATNLAILLITIALCAKLTAQQTAVIISFTEQTAYLLVDGRVAFVSPIASGKEGWATPIGSFRVISKDLNHQSGNFGLVRDSYGRIVNPNATPASYVPPGCHYMPAPMPNFMEFRKYVGMHGGYLPVFGQLQDALNTIWGVKPKPGKSLVSFLRARFLSFAMVAGVCFLLLVSLNVSPLLHRYVIPKGTCHARAELSGLHRKPQNDTL